MALHNEIGKIGESLAVSFLMKLDFTILEKNYRTKQGEIDIIATKNNVLHYIEVKTIQVNSLTALQDTALQPEDNFTPRKMERIRKTIDIYTYIKKIDNTAQQIDLACVYVDISKREGRVKYIPSLL